MRMSDSVTFKRKLCVLLHLCANMAAATTRSAANKPKQNYERLREINNTTTGKFATWIVKVLNGKVSLWGCEWIWGMMCGAHVRMPERSPVRNEVVLPAASLCSTQEVCSCL